MNAEKMIKSEAKKMLSGKWPAAVTAVLTFLLLPLTVFSMIEAAYVILPQNMPVIDGLKSSIVLLVVFIVFHVAAVTIIVMLSPLYAGFARFFSIMADGGKPEVSQVFYFFETRRKYRSAMKFMTNILVKITGICMACMIPTTSFIALSFKTGHTYKIGIIITVLLGAAFAFCIIHRFGFAVMLFSYHEYAPEHAVSYGAKIAQKGTNKLIALSWSFLGMILLTITAVPFVYIYPYMTCSYFVSIKYLIKTYKEKYGDFGNSYADQNFKIDLGVGEIPQAVNPANTVVKDPDDTIKFEKVSTDKPKTENPTISQESMNVEKPQIPLKPFKVKSPTTLQKTINTENSTTPQKTIDTENLTTPQKTVNTEKAEKPTGEAAEKS